MAEVGRRARKLGPDFHLVSISVDPERDTPERLAAYGARFGANPLAWSFLTGPLGAIEKTVVDGFKIGMGKEKTPAAAADGGATGQQLFEIFHGEHLVLVDRQLRIRGYFPATPEGLDQLMEAVGRVANGA
jgi:protein SCO1/2